MQFGLYAPIPMVTVGSPEIASAAGGALRPLPDHTRDVQFDHSLALLQAADAVGFELALFAERHLGSDMTSWVLAGGIASRLERIRALVAVHPGLWDPVMTAKLAASLDRMCKGRMAINIVNGWFDQEFEMFGGKVLQGEERYERSAEFIAILRGLWTQEKLTFPSRYYKIEDAQLLLKPATSAPPEIFSVSRSERGQQFIAENCDWWFVDMAKSAESTDEMLRAIENSIKGMNEMTARMGKKVRYGINPFIAFGKDSDDALQATVDHIYKYDPDPDARKIQRRMLPATRGGCMGTPKDIRRQISRFEDMGVELLLLKLIPSVENVQKIGAEIIAPINGSPKMAIAS